MADNRAEEKPEVHPALKTSRTHANLTLSVTRPSERLTTDLIRTKQQEQWPGLHSCPCLTRYRPASRLHRPQAETSAQVKTVPLTVQAADPLTTENTFLLQTADLTPAWSPCLSPWPQSSCWPCSHLPSENNSLFSVILDACRFLRSFSLQ